MKKNPHIGSSLEDFLKEDGNLTEARTAALKEIHRRQKSRRPRNRNRSTKLDTRPVTGPGA